MGKRCFADQGHRCWVEIGLESPPNARGQTKRLIQRLIADLGCPFDLIVERGILQRFRWSDEPSKPSNFGWLEGGLVRVSMPELEFVHSVRAYSNTRAVHIARDEGFDGIAGKPFLDYFHWNNGDGGQMCIESWQQYRERRGGEQKS